MAEAFKVMVVWSSGFSSGEKPPRPYFDVFDTDGLRYKTLVAGRLETWHDFASQVSHFYPKFYEYFDEYKPNWKFEILFEYLDKADCKFYPSQWCYVLYVAFQNRADELAFYMWLHSQEEPA